MQSRPLPFSKVYRQFRYWSKQINRQVADGRFARYAPQKQAKLQAKLRRLFHRLRQVISPRHLRHVLAGAAMVVGLSGSVQAQVFAPPVTNPFGLTGNSYFNLHTEVDIDGDGDLDLFSSIYNPVTYALEVSFIENIGTPAVPNFAAPISNTFGLQGGTYFLDLEFADMDNDGDLDAIGGSYYGQVTYHENTGTVNAPAFAAPVSNPFGIPNGNYYAFPTIADLDGDGDLDLLTTEYYGEFRYYENTGTAAMPAFGTGVVAPFGLPVAGTTPDFYHPELVDLDMDGDLDILAGSYAYPSSNIYYFENTGTAIAPAFAAVQLNPFNLTTATEITFVSVADFDNDMDFDVLISEYQGNFVYFENIDSVANPVNTPPTLDMLASQTLCSGDTLDLPFMATDADGDSLIFMASSDDPAILDDADISISGTDPNFVLSAVPMIGAFGVVNVTVMAFDGTDTTSSTFPLLVENCNTAPAIGTINDVSLCRDSTWDNFSFQIIDAEGDPLTVTATSDNQTLVPDANLSVSGASPLFTFTGTPAPGETGTATITVIADDGLASDTATFNLEIVACNTAPIIEQLEDQTACSFFIYGPLDVAISDADNDALTVSALSSNQALIPDANISLTGTAPAYALTLQPVAGQTGSAEITLTAADDSTSTSSTFVVTVELCTNIDEARLTQALKLYPNPTRGMITLEAEAALQAQEIQLMDLQGRTLRSIQSDGLQTRWDLNLQDLPAGTYLVQVRHAGGVLYRRINKQ